MHESTSTWRDDVYIRCPCGRTIRFDRSGQVQEGDILQCGRCGAKYEAEYVGFRYRRIEDGNADRSPLVYTLPTSTRYHKKLCSYIKFRCGVWGITILKIDAIEKGLKPCLKCNP